MTTPAQLQPLALQPRAAVVRKPPALLMHNRQLAPVQLAPLTVLIRVARLRPPTARLTRRMRPKLRARSRRIRTHQQRTKAPAVLAARNPANLYRLPVPSFR